MGVAFRGDTASDTIAKILEREPDWSLLPVPTPVFIRRLLRCLTKDPKQRQRDIGDVRIELSAIDEMLPAGSDKTAAFALEDPDRVAAVGWARGARVRAGADAPAGRRGGRPRWCPRLRRCA